MDIRPIRTEEDHDAALAEIERLWHAMPGTFEHDQLEVLGTLVSVWEDRHWPIEPGDPVDAIRFRMEQSGYTQADLAALLGSRSRASEILKRKRVLTMAMAAKLSRQWRIPAEALIAPVKSAGRAAAYKTKRGTVQKSGSLPARASAAPHPKKTARRKRVKSKRA